MCKSKCKTRHEDYSFYLIYFKITENNLLALFSVEWLRLVFIHELKLHNVYHEKMIKKQYVTEQITNNNKWQDSKPPFIKEGYNSKLYPVHKESLLDHIELPLDSHLDQYEQNPPRQHQLLISPSNHQLQISLNH